MIAAEAPGSRGALKAHYFRYPTEEERCQPGKPGCIGREGERLGPSRAFNQLNSEGKSEPTQGEQWYCTQFDWLVEET